MVVFFFFHWRKAKGSFLSMTFEVHLKKMKSRTVNNMSIFYLTSNLFTYFIVITL